jgi:hypothetical protein
MYNSTIHQKKKICTSCGKECYWFSRKRCQSCATREDTLKRIERQNDHEMEREGLADLVKVADDVFSKFIRLSHADENGNVTCYTCDAVIRWQEAHNGHYVGRGNMFLRFDQRNCRPQCYTCNVSKNGNLAEYTRRLELEHTGITDFLKEEATVPYKHERHELQSQIVFWKRWIKALQKNI